MSASLRSAHDELLATLSRRQSVLHFAHAAVACFVVVVFSGAAWRLSLDAEHAWAPSLIGPALLVAGTALAYALVRLLLGRARLVDEVRAFEELKRLRAQLGLEKPNVLEHV